MSAPHEEVFLLLEDGGQITLEAEVGSIFLEEFNSGTVIENTGAVVRALSENTICDRSGRKAYPHELIKDSYSGNMILKRHLDEPQQYTRAWRSESGTGPKRAETEDTFITTAITPDDL